MNRSSFYIEGSRILIILFDVFFADFRSSYAFLFGSVYYLIVHVGEVLNKFHLVASVFQILSQCVKNYKGSGVPDMEKIINRRPADIHLNLSFLYGNEFLFSSGKGIIYFHPLFLLSDSFPE